MGRDQRGVALRSHPPLGRTGAQGESKVKGWKWGGDLRIQIAIIAALILIIWVVLQWQYY
jgi:hypothetical protein